ncbi:23181_t:CDS:2, partial [Racocetra persica]
RHVRSPIKSSIERQRATKGLANAVAGIHPQKMLSALRQNNPDLAAISKAIYNTCDTIRRDNLQDYTPLQALFDKLKEENVEYDHQYDPNSHLTHLFFAHHTSILLTKAYDSTLLIDYTPRPQVIGTDRELALINAICIVFSESKNFLCIWHIEKNMLANCRNHFSTEELSDFLKSWTTIIKSKMEEDFSE